MKLESGNSYQINLNGALEEINDLSLAIDQFSSQAGLSTSIKNQINLILEELYTNTINYGFSGIENGTVSIKLNIHNNVLEMLYQDNGIAFNPLENADPELMLSIEDKAIGGLGVFFVKAMTESAEYERDGGFNRLKMFKSLTKELSL